MIQIQLKGKKLKMGYILTPTEDHKTIFDEVEPSNGSNFTLEELQKAVGGGYIEVAGTVHFGLTEIDKEIVKPALYTVYVNEDGISRFMNREPEFILNETISLLLNTQIFGPVLLTTLDEEEAREEEFQLFKILG